jgi:hypothetical protein
MNHNQKLGRNSLIFPIFVKKALEGNLDLLKLVLPELLVEHFNLVQSKIEGERVDLYFEEQNKPPIEHSSKVLISKGLYNGITIQDFPLRGKKVMLHIKRRRWTDKNTSAIVQRDWKLVAKGSRMTEEFADFLKEISRF